MKFLLILLLLYWFKDVYCDTLTLVLDNDGNPMVYNGIANNWTAQAIFENNIDNDGWTYLEVQTNAYHWDLMQSYGAGFIEAVVTRPLIYNSWRNTQEGFCKWKGEEYCDKLIEFLEKNLEWMKDQIILNKHTPYWHQVELILAQLLGLSEGYNAYAPLSERIPLLDFLLMNLSGDLEDLDNIFNPVTFEDWINSKAHFGDGHCSALIKVLPNNEDLLVSHVTWNTYQSMLRVQKKYIFHFSMTNTPSNEIPGARATFSSYPAYLSSGDDFTLLSSGLLSMETTIGNSNPELWKNVKPEGELHEWMRAIVANRLATNAKEWCQIFMRYNSGTYNNQWMIVDYKRFKKGKPIKPKTFYVLEQIPGNIHYNDQSKLLRAQTYWPSYNTPFYRDIFNMSGLPALVEKYGDWFTYDKTPRARIFQRDHVKVTNLSSLFNLMRYNDFKHDPFSACKCQPPYSAENAISARSELNPKNGTYPFGSLGHRNHGGTDCKATSSDLFHYLRFMAVSGPTYNQQPVFRWSEQDFANSTPHYGHPDAWKFPIVLHKWVW